MLAYVLDERYSFLLLLSKDIEQISGKTELEPRFLSELNPPPSASLELMEWGVKEEGGRGKEQEWPPNSLLKSQWK